MLNYCFHLTGTERMRRTLKKDAVPSVFSWSLEPSASTQERLERAEKRAKNREIEPEFQPDIDVMEVEVSEETVAVGDIQESSISMSDATSQTAAWTRMDISDLKLNPKVLQYYTGLDNSEHFDFILTTLGPAAYHLNYRWRRPLKPSIENQLLITLIKLRLHTPNIELTFLFDVCETTISNIFVTWVNFMYVKWSQLDIWPSKELVQFYMPNSFKQEFANTRLIIDGVEVPVQKPSQPKAQQITYSSYKNRNTLKTIVGISPGGLTSYIPDAHGGSSSDRILVERSDLTQRCDPKDSIMCDKGFDVQDIFAPFDVKINMPTFMRKKNQLTNEEVIRDRKIASQRVHVERVIGLAKTYKILTTPMTNIETCLGSRIIFVCFMLCNFRQNIVTK